MNTYYVKLLCINVIIILQAAFVPASESALDTSYFTSRYTWNTSEEHGYAASDTEDSSDGDSMSGSSSPTNRHDEVVSSFINCTVY